MASKLRRFEFRAQTGREAVYPWDEWARLNAKGEGSIYEIIQGEDYTIPSRNMQAQLFVRARRLGLKVRTSQKTTTGEAGLVFRFYNAPGQQDL